MARRIIGTLGLLVVGMALTATAQPPAASITPPADKSLQNLIDSIQNNQRKFEQFKFKLLELAQRWEKCDKPEEGQRAENLNKAIEVANNINPRFDKLIEAFRGKNLNIGDLNEALKEDEATRSDLRKILALLLTDSNENALKKEKKRILDLLKKIISDIEAMQPELLDVLIAMKLKMIDEQLKD